MMMIMMMMVMMMMTKTLKLHFIIIFLVKKLKKDKSTHSPRRNKFNRFHRNGKHSPDCHFVFMSLLKKGKHFVLYVWSVDLAVVHSLTNDYST